MAKPTQTQTATAGPKIAPPASDSPLVVIERHVSDAAREYGKLKAVEDLKFAQERLFFMSIVQKSEKLMNASKESLLDAFLQAGSIGLSFNPLVGHVYLVPRNARTKRDDESWPDFKKNVPVVAYASPGYRGLIHLAIAGGAIKMARAEVVYERDHFRYLGPTTKVEFEASGKGGGGGTFNAFTVNRGAKVGVFCEAQMVDGTWMSDMMDAAQVARVKNKSEAKNSLMWTDFEEEGWKKAVLRRAQKTWPRMVAAPMFQRAIEILNEHEGIDLHAPAIEHNPDPISEDQVLELHSMITNTGSSGEDADKLLGLLAKRYGRATIKDLPVTQFDEAKQKVAEKIEAKKAKAEKTKE